jgi:hypothetical protein
MRPGGWLGLLERVDGLLGHGVLGLLRGLRVMRGENKNSLVDHDIQPLTPLVTQMPITSSETI